MSMSTIRRQVKNVACNYSFAQIKAREATSNEQWGPSTQQMLEIAELTTSPTAFIEIMSIVWKRLNDSGRNWRHVYKSLVLIEFLIDNGPDKVAQQCRENLHAFEALKSFRHTEENRDKGISIREKAQTIIVVLSKPVAAKKKVAVTRMTSDVDEDVALQIALAESREQMKKDETKRFEEGKKVFAQYAAKEKFELAPPPLPAIPTSSAKSTSALDDLLSLGGASNDPWGIQTSSDSKNDNQKAHNSPVYANLNSNNNPFEFDSIIPPVTTAANTINTASSFDDFFGGNVLTPTSNAKLLLATPKTNGSTTHKNVENFLGENKNLVNLDNLFGKTNGNDGAGPSIDTNPFNAQRKKSPTLDQMRSSQGQFFQDIPFTGAF